MNNKLIVVIVAVVVLAALGWFLFFASSSKPAATSTAPTGTLPISGSVPVPVSTGASSSGSYGSDTMTVPALSGGSVVMADFVHNGVTLPDSANVGRYLLAGDLGYCATEPQKCQAGAPTDFNIFYDSTSGSFTIALLKEPLGQVRLAMEQSLMSTLSISQVDMCKLNYYVGTTFDINALYSTKNLGFSFCPGATVLPK